LTAGTQCHDARLDTVREDVLPTSRAKQQLSPLKLDSKESMGLEAEKEKVRSGKILLSPIHARNNRVPSFESSRQSINTPLANAIVSKNKHHVYGRKEIRTENQLAMRQKLRESSVIKVTEYQEKYQINQEPNKLQSFEMSASSDGVQVEDENKSEDEPELFIRDIANLESESLANQPEVPMMMNDKSKPTFSDFIQKNTIRGHLNSSLSPLSKGKSVVKTTGPNKKEKNSRNINTELFGKSIERTSNKGVDMSHRLESAMSNSMIGNQTVNIKQQANNPNAKDLNMTMGALFKYNAADNSICFGDADKYSEFYGRMKSQCYRNKTKPVNILDGLDEVNPKRRPRVTFEGRSSLRKPSKSVKGDEPSNNSKADNKPISRYSSFSKFKSAERIETYTSHRHVNNNISRKGFTIEPKELIEGSSVALSQGEYKDSVQVSVVKQLRSHSQESELTIRRQQNESIVAKTSQINQSKLDLNLVAEQNNMSLRTLKVRQNFSGVIHEDQEDMDSSSQSEGNIVPLKYKEVRGLYKKHTNLLKGVDLNTSLPCIKMIPVNQESHSRFNHEIQEQQRIINGTPQNSHSPKIEKSPFNKMTTIKSSKRSAISNGTPLLKSISRKHSFKIQAHL
jgi:hypothetical protein